MKSQIRKCEEEKKIPYRSSKNPTKEAQKENPTAYTQQVKTPNPIIPECQLKN